jgi:hypothetical protein
MDGCGGGGVRRPAPGSKSGHAAGRVRRELDQQHVRGACGGWHDGTVEAALTAGGVETQHWWGKTLFNRFTGS